MVSKKLGEEEIRSMFCQFGAIEDCTVLRDDNGISRGEDTLYWASRDVTCHIASRHVSHCISWRHVSLYQVSRVREASDALNFKRTKAGQENKFNQEFVKE